tara:strand:- start:469 stop:726 length:258 start_codon:yes stop_codon:yes gene_type:complete
VSRVVGGGWEASRGGSAMLLENWAFATRVVSTVLGIFIERQKIESVLFGILHIFPCSTKVVFLDDVDVVVAAAAAMTNGRRRIGL